MPSDQVLCLVPQLTMLQDLLDLVLFMFIDFHWWGIGSHSTVLIGLQKADVKDIMNASQCLSMPSPREVQTIGSLPYMLGYLEWSNEPVVQLSGALQSQVPSA